MLLDQTSVHNARNNDDEEDPLLYELLKLVPTDSDMWGQICAKFRNASKPTECAVAIARTLDVNLLLRFRASLMQWARQEEERRQERHISDHSVAPPFVIPSSITASPFAAPVSITPVGRPVAHWDIKSQQHQLLVQQMRHHIESIHSRLPLPPRHNQTAIQSAEGAESVDGLSRNGESVSWGWKSAYRDFQLTRSQQAGSSICGSSTSSRVLLGGVGDDGVELAQLNSLASAVTDIEDTSGLDTHHVKYSWLHRENSSIDARESPGVQECNDVSNEAVVISRETEQHTQKVSQLLPIALHEKKETEEEGGGEVHTRTRDTGQIRSSRQLEEEERKAIGIIGASEQLMPDDDTNEIKFGLGSSNRKRKSYVYSTESEGEAEGNANDALQGSKKKAKPSNDVHVNCKHPSGCHKSGKGRTDGFCHDHGGQVLCRHTGGCEKLASVKGGLCLVHGGVGKCTHVSGCATKAQRHGLCVVHGGGKQYMHVEGCVKSQGKGRKCFDHGDGITCSHGSGCAAQARVSWLSNAHGGKPRCTHPDGCVKQPQGKGGRCFQHGGGTKCKHCEKQARSNDLCPDHGPKCSHASDGRLRKVNNVIWKTTNGYIPPHE